MLRNKKKTSAPRPHTVHIESGGGDASITTDKTVTLNRSRTYSDPAETEQDENKPPLESVSKITRVLSLVLLNHIYSFCR